MTTNPTEASRNAFEECFPDAKKYRSYDGKYWSNSIDNAWSGWQISEARMRAQMQELVEAAICVLDNDGGTGSKWYHAFLLYDARIALREALAKFTTKQEPQS